jgi:hypothetical protein
MPWSDVCDSGDSDDSGRVAAGSGVGAARPLAPVSHPPSPSHAHSTRESQEIAAAGAHDRDAAASVRRRRGRLRGQFPIGALARRALEELGIDADGDDAPACVIHEDAIAVPGERQAANAQAAETRVANLEHARLLLSLAKHPGSHELLLGMRLARDTQTLELHDCVDSRRAVASHAVDPRVATRNKGWLSNFASESMFLNVDRRVVKSTRQAVASAIVVGERAAHDTLVRSVQAAVEDGVLEPVVYFERLAYDETPLKLRVESSFGLAKLLQSEFEWVMVVRSTATGKHLVMSAETSTFIQAIDRNTAECLAAATSQIAYRPALVNDIFPSRVRLVTCDDFRANDRCERWHSHTNPGWVTSKLPCQVHKCQGVAAQTNSLLNGDIAGLVNLMLSVSQVGQLQSFRVEMGLLLEEILDVRFAAPPLDQDAIMYKSAVVTSFCGDTGSSTSEYSAQWKQQVLTHLANDDWRQQGIFIHIEVGCCSSRADTLRQLKELFIPVLTSGWKVFNRSKWTGSEEVYRSVALAESIHGLLNLTFKRFVGKKYPRFITPDGLDAAIEELKENVDDDDEEGADINEWHKKLRRWVAKAMRWIVTGFLPRIIVLHTVSVGRRAMLSKMLSTSSRAWERKQEQNMLRTGARDYQVLLRRDGHYTNEFVAYLAHLTQDPAAWENIMEADRTTELRCLAFRAVARAAAALHELLVLPQRNYPYIQFGLLNSENPDGLASSIVKDVNEAPCRFDPYTRDVVKRYPTAEALLSPPARMERLIAASTSKLCITRLEAKHARVRRLTKMMSLQTHGAGIEDMSAAFLSIGAKEERAAKARPAEAADSDTVRRPARRVSSWNSFTHEHLKEKTSSGRLASDDFANAVTDVSERYRSLGDEERNVYKARAEEAQARVEAGLPPFPLRGAKLERHIKKLQRKAVEDTFKQPCPQDASALERTGGALILHPLERQDLEPKASKLLDCRRELRQRAWSQARGIRQTEKEHATQLQQFSYGEALDAAVKSNPEVLAPRAAEFRAVPIAEGTAFSLDHVKDKCSNQAVLAASAKEFGTGVGLRAALLELWSQKHELIRHDDAPRLGRVPLSYSPCWLAGRCVCKGEGLGLARFRQSFIRGYTSCSPYSAADFKAIVDAGFLVLCLSGHALQKVPLQTPGLPGDGVVDCREGVKREWLHVSMTYGIGRRPTFWLMRGPEWSPQLPGRVCLQPLVQDGGPLVLSALQLAGRVDLSLAWDIDFYRLVANGSPLVSVVPGEVEATLEPENKTHKVWPLPPKPPQSRLQKKRAESSTEPRKAAKRCRKRSGWSEVVSDERGDMPFEDSGHAGDDEEHDDDVQAADDLEATYAPEDDDICMEGLLEEIMGDSSGPPDMSAVDDFDNGALSSRSSSDGSGDLFGDGFSSDDAGDVGDFPHGPRTSGSAGAGGGSGAGALCDSDGDGDDELRPPPLPASVPLPLPAAASEQAAEPRAPDVDPQLPLPAAPRRHGPRGPAQDRYVFCGGEIRINVHNNTACAHCYAHGANICRRTRSLSTGGRAGQGRPLGHLVAWLTSGGSASQDEHKAMPAPALHTRQAARAEMHADPSYRNLLAAERLKAAGEDSEPDVVT